MKLPVIILCMTLVFAAAIGAMIGAIATVPSFCDRAESGLVCARNWTGSAGNLAAALIAITAAFIAWNQYRTAAHTVGFAALPTLTERLTGARRLASIVKEHRSKIEQLGARLDELYAALAVGKNGRDFLDLCAQAEKAWVAASRYPTELIIRAARDEDIDQFVDIILQNRNDMLKELQGAMALVIRGTSTQPPQEVPFVASTAHLIKQRMQIRTAAETVRAKASALGPILADIGKLVAQTQSLRRSILVA